MFEHKFKLIGAGSGYSVGATDDECRKTVSLDGTWHVALDPDGTENWHAVTRGLPPAETTLFGSLTQQGLGNESSHQHIGTWIKQRQYVGTVWHVREFCLPASLTGCRLQLRLAGAHWATNVWVDGQWMIPYAVTMIPVFKIIKTFGWVNTHYALIAPALTSAFGTSLYRMPDLRWPL